jgi:hypothetical protein
METLTEERPSELEAAVLLELASFPEQYQEAIAERWAEVKRILESTVPPELLAKAVASIRYEAAPSVETNNQYQIKAVAHCENNGRIVVFESFFEKNYAEQQYILAHETAHALAAVLFSRQDSYDELATLNQEANVNGETKYVRHAAKQKEAGRLKDSDVFAEQTAERLTAFLLGGGDLGNILEVQALYLEDPAALFEGLPEQALADKDQLTNHLASGAALNPLIKDTSAYREFFDRMINGEEDNEDELIEWEMGLIDTEMLGTSGLLDAYVGHQQSSSQPLSVWGFLAELFSQPAAKAS